MNRHGYYSLTKEDLDKIEMEWLKQIYCEQYRKDECNGCKYYDPEDQVCRFDK